MQDWLQWYLEAGVDECIGPDPVDRFAMSAPSRAAVPPPLRPPAGGDERALPRRAPAVSPVAPLTPPPAQTLPAQTPPAHHSTTAHLAAECQTLDHLRRAMESFDGLPLKRTAKSTVFADGNPQADLMIIGEAPGQDEDRQGLPFVGKSGKLLDRMLRSIGLERSDVYITNVVPWRPLENRKPSHDEIATCLPFITRHIELVDPKMLLLLGGASASAILARSDSISRLRGQWFDYSSPHLPRPIPVLASFHPAYLLRTPAAKQDAWRDFLLLTRRLRALSLPQ